MAQLYELLVVISLNIRLLSPSFVSLSTAVWQVRRRLVTFLWQAELILIFIALWMSQHFTVFVDTVCKPQILGKICVSFELPLSCVILL